MSLEILLIPAALAAYSAWQARADADQAAGAAGVARSACVVQTRLRSPQLLMSAMSSVGAAVHVEGDRVVGRLGAAELSFRTNSEGVAVAHVAGIDAAEAERLVHLIDAEYAAAVQTQLYERLHQRAESLGLKIESESVAADNSITVVLTSAEAR